MIDLTWAGHPPRSARNALYNHIHRLRQALARDGEAPLRTIGTGYLIDTADHTLDLTTVRALCTAGRTAAARHDWTTASAQLSQALALWHCHDR